jgi:DNA-directed RNA polymerase subunit RPC12/RpoP
MPENVKQYKCPTCGSTLEFDAEHQSVKCGTCGNTYSITAFSEKDDAKNGGFDWGDYKRNLSSDTIANTTVYQCEACGAVIETEATTMATACPFCENNVVIKDRASGGLRPNGIIPFKVTKDELPGILKKFYHKKKLLPSNFFSKSVLEKAQGVYVPFWLYDSDINGSVSFTATKERHYREGNYSCTETKYYDVYRSGAMSFSQIPVDASVKMDNDMMDSLEPFDYADLKPFDGVYLTGYVADRFDSSPDDEVGRAGERMRNSTVAQFRSTVTGYSSVSAKSEDLKLKNASVSYVLLPVYIINCHYNDKVYQYAVNGQTGKVVGELPISKAKYWMFFAKAFAIASAIAAAILYWLAD